MSIKPLVLKGIYDITHRGADGKVKSFMQVYNTITNAGMSAVAGLINGVGSTTFSFIGIGSSQTAAAVANTSLAAEITSPSLARVAATTSQQTTSVAGDTAQLLKTFSSTATQAVQEVGVFDTASGGTLLSRATFSAKNLTSGDTLQITHKTQVQ